MPSASPILHSLRQTISLIGRDGTRVMSSPEDHRALLGHAMIDAALGGGLMRGSLHDILPASPADHAAASGFALALIACLTGKQDWIWIRQDIVDREKGRPYGPGLAGFGLDPRQTIHVVTRDIDDMLKATEDSLRCGALGAVLCEPWGEAKSLDLTATRRLTLAAEMSGVPLIMLRRGHGDMPTAARTRWRIAPAPSVNTQANTSTATTGPGHARFSVSLVVNRQRDAAAPQGFWITEWCHGERSFRSADHVGDLSLSADRPPDTVGARSRRAAR